MRNDEAIELLCAYGVPLDEEKFQEALDMGIKALKQTDGDLISRQAVLDIFGDIHPLDYNARAYVAQIKELPSEEQNLKEKFEREIEIANKDIDFAEGTDESEENYMRGYLGGILCAYRIVFGKNYEEKTE
jgi:hypothetical protein